jgi:hypothetical protein
MMADWLEFVRRVLEFPGFNLGQRLANVTEEFVLNLQFSETSRPAVGPTKLPIQGTPGFVPGDGVALTTYLPLVSRLTLSLLMSYIYGAPCTARNFNVVYIYGPTFGNAESRLFLFAVQCFNTESVQKVLLCNRCM